MTASLIRCQTSGHEDRLCTTYWRGVRYCAECWAREQVQIALHAVAV